MTSSIKILNVAQLQSRLTSLQDRLKNAQEKLDGVSDLYQQEMARILKEVKELKPQMVMDHRDLGYESGREPLTMGRIREIAKKHNLDPEYLEFRPDDDGYLDISYRKESMESFSDFHTRRAKLEKDKGDKAWNLRNSRVRTHTNTIHALNLEIKQVQEMLQECADTQEALEAAQKTLTPAQLKALGLPVLDTPDPWGVNRG